MNYFFRKRFSAGSMSASLIFMCDFETAEEVIFVLKCVFVALLIIVLVMFLKCFKLIT